MSRLLSNIFSLFALQGINYLLPLITVPYLVRVLGPENFGRIAFAQGFIQFFVLLTDFGFNFSATHAVAIERNDSERLSRLFSAVMIAKTGLMVIGLVLMLLIVSLVPSLQQDRNLYLLVYLTAVGSVLYPVWLFQGLERMRHIAALTIFARFLTVIAIFIFVHERGDYLVAATLQASSVVISGLFALLIISRMKSIRPHWTGLSEVRRVMADGMHVFLSTAAISLYTGSNVFVLGLLTNTTAVGYFAAAEKVIKAVQGLISPISQAVYPHIAALGARSRVSALTFAGKLLRIQGLATLVLSVSLFFLAGPLVRLLLGPQFQSSIALVQWMAALPFVIGLSNIFGVQVMLNLGMKQVFTRILIACGLFNIALIIPLAGLLGAQGAAISVLLTEVLVTVLMGFTLQRNGFMRIIIRKGTA